MTRYRSGKEIEIATFFQFQAFPEFGYRHGEITHSDIRFIDASKSGFQFALVHRGGLLDEKTTAREIADIAVGHEQMAVFVELGDLEPLFEQSETARFHNRRIRLEKVSLRAHGDRHSDLRDATLIEPVTLISLKHLIVVHTK